MVIAKITLQGVRRDDSCPKTAGCQEKNRRSAEAMSVLYWGDLSTLGAGDQAREGYLPAESAGVSVSLLFVWADISASSRRDDTGGSE
jgi:hypothetical protein